MSNKRKKRGSFLDLSRSNSTSSSEDRRSPLTLYSRLRIGLLFQVLPNTPSPASSPPPSGNRRTKMDGRVPSRAVEEEEEEEEWSFDSNCSEASEGSDQDSLGWLNALANSTFEESSWISRKSSEPKRGVATTPTNTKTIATEAESDLVLRRNSMHTWFEDSTAAAERRSSPKSQSPFLCYESDEEYAKEESSNSKFTTINKWLDSASHFLDVRCKM